MKVNNRYIKKKDIIALKFYSNTDYGFDENNIFVNIRLKKQKNIKCERITKKTMKKLKKAFKNN